MAAPDDIEATGRRWLSVEALILAVVMGVVVGFSAYLLTSMGSGDQGISYCNPGQSAGFDPWTGLPHGASWSCPQLHPDGTQTAVTQVLPMPAALTGRRAIPVPVGFAVGALTILAFSMAQVAWLRRRPSD